MSFGVFEAATGSDHEVGLARQASADKMAAAIYDVREKLGPFLMSASSVEEFRDRVAMTKNDQSLYKVIEAAGLFPNASSVRKIAGPSSVLEKEFKEILRSAADATPTPGVGVAVPGTNLETGNPNASPNAAPGPVATPGSTVPTGTGGTLGLNPTAPGIVGYRQACYPGCESNEAHAAKFHKDKEARLGVYDTVNHPKWDNGVVDTNETFEDHQGKELKPKGDFKGYLNKVDQGGPSKVKRNFATKQAVAVYVDWCKSQDLSPARLSSLDAYSGNLSDAQYFTLAKVIQAWDNEHHPKVPSTELKSKDKVAGRRKQAYGNNEMGTSDDFNSPAPHSPQAEYQHPGHARGWQGKFDQDQYEPYTGEHYNKSGVEVHGGPGPDGSRYHVFTPGGARSGPHSSHEEAFNVGDAFLNKVHKALRESNKHRYALQYLAWCSKHSLAEADPTNLRTYGKHQSATRTHLQPLGFQHIASCMRFALESSRARYAAPDYLQKADDALTQLLNQKAEEFQTTIAPLQQALMTVQQATQLQQQQNPMNVLPPPGTVNVMPGQSQTPAQIGMPDPNAPDLSGTANALANPIGGAPPPDAGGGGEPPPAAADGGLPPELTARKRGGQGKGRGAFAPRQASGIGEKYDRWRKQRSQGGDLGRGGEVDYDQFATETGAGERAMSKLRKRNEQPDFEPINNPEAIRGGGVTVGGSRGRRKQAWSGWGPDQFPKTREVTGWKWDDHLNGYLANRPERFACDCGSSFNTPTGFKRCACGKSWNSYVIGGTGGSNKEASADKYLVREIPTRHDVIVASRQREARPTWKYRPKPGEQEEADATGIPLPKRSAPAEILTRTVAPWKGDYYPSLSKKGATDHWHDNQNRYTGPASGHADLSTLPDGGYGRSPGVKSDFCASCGNHYAKGHDAGCEHAFKGASSRGPSTPRRDPQYNKPTNRDWADKRGKPRQLVDLQQGDTPEEESHAGFDLAGRRRFRAEDAQSSGGYGAVPMTPGTADRAVTRTNPELPGMEHPGEMQDPSGSLSPHFKPPGPSAGPMTPPATQLPDPRGPGWQPGRTQEPSGGRIGREGVVHLTDPRTGKIYNLVDPGELSGGKENGLPSMKYPPKDWANRGDGAKWTKSPIGK